MKKKISIPNANRTIEALRSLGYDLGSSIADLIDNSITNKVGSTKVAITFKTTGGKFKIRIVDNGIGMTEGFLEEAMRFGSDTSYEDGDLGKFGMGMKTASIAHCNELTVISKKKGSKITGFKWDLNHVKKSNDGWVVFELTAKEIENILRKEKFSITTNGTIVLLDDLFLLDEQYNNYDSKKLAGNFLFRTEENLRLHLRMVFHKFLDSKKVAISFNNQQLQPWDPFCKKEPRTQEIKLPKDLSHFYIKGYKHPIIIKAYVLPTKEAFSGEKAWKEAKGPQSWNDSQGYYIYRANRIIRSGGWQGTKAKDEHDKLARLSIEIHPELDSLFRITVNKDKIEFPDALFNHLKNHLNPKVIKSAQSQYRNSEEKNKFKNKVRGNDQMPKVAQQFIYESQITTKISHVKNEVVIKNPGGTWASNSIKEFASYGNDHEFEIISDHIKDGMLWKVICNENEKIKVIVNSKHPFYSKIYTTSSNKNVTNATDALIAALAMAELYVKSTKTVEVIDNFKHICSGVIEKLVKEKVI